MAKLPFLANLKHKLDNCGVCVREGEAVLVIAYVLSDGATEVYDTYAAKWNGQQRSCVSFHGTWPVVINSFIKRL